MVLVGVGLFLVLFISAITLVVGMLLYGAAGTNPETARKLNDESHILVVAVLLLGSLIAFGFHGVISGLWMVAFGKRNRVMLWIMWAILLTVGVIAAALQLLLP
jgi:succinate dehydrogenase/fumarate reductase cytochrome b subunit